MEKVTDLIKEINTNLTHASASNRDEVRVMRAFLNDTSYTVGVYGKEGKEGEYCPAKDFKSMIGGIIADTTKMNKEEAAAIAEKYEVKRSDAETMIGLSKEFFNSYLQTGRKIGLGCREKSNVSLIKKDIPASTRYFPKQTGVDDNGNAIFTKGETKVPAYESIKVISPCPSHIK